MDNNKKAIVVLDDFFGDDKLTYDMSAREAWDCIKGLLKEQEAVKPIHRCWNGRITQLNKINGYAFCPYCGKPVDWGENVLL